MAVLALQVAVLLTALGLVWVIATASPSSPHSQPQPEGREMSRDLSDRLEAELYRCNPMYPAHNPVYLVCSPMCPACTPMYPRRSSITSTCNPMYPRRSSTTSPTPLASSLALRGTNTTTASAVLLFLPESG